MAKHEGERNRKSWHANNHTTRQKACAWHVHVYVDMIVEKETLSMSKGRYAWHVHV